MPTNQGDGVEVEVAAKRSDASLNILGREAERVFAFFRVPAARAKWSIGRLSTRRGFVPRATDGRSHAAAHPSQW